jgi:hypothetical protein
MRRNGQRGGGVDPDEEIDENFWARAAADRAEAGQDLHQLGEP